VLFLSQALLQFANPEKGSTVFRPVAKARSRAPTVVPSQPSSRNSRTVHEDNPTQQSLSQADSFIAPPANPELQPSQQQDMIIDSLFSAHGIDFSGPPIHSDSPPVLINTSNLPSSLMNVGRNMSNSITMPQQDNRPPMVFPHPFDLSHELVMMTSDPSQQTSVIFTPSGQPAESTNTLMPPVFDNCQKTPTSENPSRQQAQEIYIEKPRRKRRIDSDGITSQPKSRSITPRQRRSRGPSLPPFNPNVDPGEDIDPTVITMATLCNDTGQGRVSSKAAEILTNHAVWKARNRERRTRMRVAMEAKKYGRQVEQETEQHPSVPMGDAATPNDSNENAGQSTLGTDEQTGIDYSQQMETSRYNVQVRIGPNGETIIDEESLVVDRAENEDTSDYIHIVESDHTKFVNSGTYGKRYRGSRWSAEETELFFNVSQPYSHAHKLIKWTRPSHNTEKTMNLLHTYCLVVIVNLVKTNSRPKIRKITLV